MPAHNHIYRKSADGAQRKYAEHPRAALKPKAQNSAAVERINRQNVKQKKYQTDFAAESKIQNQICCRPCGKHGTFGGGRYFLIIFYAEAVIRQCNGNRSLPAEEQHSQVPELVKRGIKQRFTYPARLKKRGKAEHQNKGIINTNPAIFNIKAHNPTVK